ncbi:MAG: hypothetical protein FWC73_08720 [Defluviitaleaceae bacterium]|nr:hypothetical protein [Defluviitaleaceae bacterium]
MDCKQANLAMMEHMEKTIQPQQAQDLARHVMSCEDCREYYIGFDMALDILNEPELSIAPPGFTNNVMAQVRELPAHTKPIPLFLRILWGFGGIILGIALLLAFNPEWLTAITEASPILYNIQSAMLALSAAVASWLADWMASYQGTGNLMLHGALVFVAAVGALLLILQRSEKSTKA